MKIIQDIIYTKKQAGKIALGLLLLCLPVLLSAQQVLFVVGDTQLSATDNSIQTILQGLNYTITIADDNTVSASDATGKDLVILASSVSSSTIGTTFTNSAVPVLVMDKDLQDDMGLVATGSGQKGGTTGKSVDIVDATHPLAADLGGAVQVFSNSNVIAWGVPNSNAVVIANKINSSNILYYAYESGAAMPGLTAPARRTFFFLHENGGDQLLERGVALLSAAIQWTAGATLPYPSSKPRVLFILEDTDLSMDSDSAFWSMLHDELGYNVVLEDEQHYTISDTANIDMIFISSSVNSGNIGTAFTDVPIPIITTEPYLLDDLGMISGSASFGNVNSQNLDFVNPNDPLSGGLSGVQAVYTQSAPVAYGQADTSAHIVAHVPGNPDQSAIFYYEPGENMPGLSAPARRMAFFTYDDAGTVINPATWDIFKQIIQYTLIGTQNSNSFTGKYGLGSGAQYGLTPLADGNFMLMGAGPRVGSGPSNHDFQAVKIDKQGQILGEYAFDSPHLNETPGAKGDFQLLTQTTNGDLVVSILGTAWDATNSSFFGNGTSPIIMRMDQNRNIIFHKYLKVFSGNMMPRALKATKDNSVLVLSTVIHEGIGRLAKIDVNANVLWSKAFNYSRFNPVTMTVLADSSIMVLGEITPQYPNPPEEDYAGFHLVKLSSTGSLLWEYEYDMPGTDKVHVETLTQLSNGNILVTGSADQNGEEKILIAEVNTTGVMQQSRYIDLGGSGNSSAYAIKALSTGGYLLAGGTENLSSFGKQEPFFAKIGAGGNLEWFQVYEHGIDNYSNFYGITPVQEGGFILNGGQYATRTRDFPGLLVKVDDQGELDGTLHCLRKEIETNNISLNSLTMPRSNYGITVPDQLPLSFDDYTAETSEASMSLGVVSPPTACPLVLPPCPPVHLEFMTPDTDKNFIATYTPRVPISLAQGTDPKTELQNLTYASELVQQISYVDGLGRPEQQIAPQSAGDGSDIITYLEIDGFNRAPKQYMPYESASTFGDYVDNPAADQQSFYTSAFPDYGTNRLFTETQYEESPRNRKIAQIAPGDAWETHPVSMSYDLNAVDEVYFIPLDIVPGTNINTYYPANELSKTETTDENGGKSITYTDKMGKTIMTAVEIDNSDFAKTYYAYDKYGNVKYVLPPEASEAVFEDTQGNSTKELSQGIVDAWCFQYEYDDRNRVSRKKVPGAGWVELVYNQLDQLVLTQDANQADATTQKWLYTKYDAFARPIETGLFTSSSAKSNLQGDIDGAALFETRQSGNDGYTNSAFPTSNTEKLSITYYDDYDFDRNGSDDYERVAGTANEKSRGFITGVKTKVLDSDPVKWLLTLTFYDDYGRELETRAEHLHGTDIVKYELNFIGEIEKTTTEHHGPNATDITQNREYCYDHNGRLLRVVSQVNADDPIVLASYKYDVLGRQETKSLHSKDGLTYLQDVDYSYNIRGWMTGINATATAEDLFEMKLSYNEDLVEINGVGEEMFNGNISGMSWKTALDTEQHGYSFTYDKLNRLKDANYGVGTSYNQNAGRYDVDLTYDKNGNIKTLNRKGRTGANSFDMMDQLSYGYTDGNRLAHVTDAITTSVPEIEQFIDGNTSGDDYVYDENGNIIEDKNKDIIITYNHLNKPTLITLSGGTIAYVYDAAGTKLQQIVDDGSIKTNDYISGVHYTNDTLKFFQHEEGRLVPDGSIAEYRYEYNLSDHLGNARVTFSDLDDDGAIQTATEVLQTDHYYPFGMRMSMDGTSMGASPPNKYLYNGKELQSDLDLNWYDYGARMYDPSIARWNGVDAMAEERDWLTPYNYVRNNPIIRVDPTGNLDGVFLDEEGNQIGNDGISDEKVYVLKTTRRTTQGADGNGGITAIPTDGISRRDRRTAEEFIVANSGDKESFKQNSSIYSAAVELPSQTTRLDMAWSVLDDGTGGTTPANNREYGGQNREIYDSDGNPTGVNEVVYSPPGPVGDPSEGGNVSVDTPVDVRTRNRFHSHPSGTNGTSRWIQGPSLTDVNNATNYRGNPATNYVFSRDRVYIYSTNGVKATISTSAWTKAYKQ